MTPEGWQRCQVEDLLSSVGTGVSVNGQSRPREAGEIGVLRISSVTYGAFRPEENKAVLANEMGRIREPPRKGCVLVSRANTQDLVGASVFVPRDFPDLVLPDKLWQLYPHPASTDGRWLQLALSTERMRARMSEVATGTSGSMKNISREKFLALDILLPPLPEQRKIAAILSSVDEAIEGTQAVIDQLQVVKKAMMADLLTRGIPGRHKTFKQTEIGRAPETWEIRRLGEILADGPTNGIYKPAHLIGRGTLLAGMTAIDDDTLRWEACRRAELDRDEESRYGLIPGDILVTRVYARLDGVGRFIVVPATTENTVFESNMMRIRVNKSLVTPQFLAALMRISALRGEIEQRATLGAQASLNSESLRSLPVCLPPLDEQERLMASLESVRDRLGTEHAHLVAAKELKSALMSVLLTGEVRVKVDEESAA